MRTAGLLNPPQADDALHPADPVGALRVSLAQNSVDSFKNELDAELLFTYALRSPLLHEMPSLLCFMPSRRDLTLG